MKNPHFSIKKTPQAKSAVFIDLKSSVSKKGKTTTQIVTFVGGVKKTITGIISSSIVQGQFTKFDTTDGRLVMINDQNVLCVEVFSNEEDSKQAKGE